MPWLAAATASGSGMRQTRTARANAVAAPATAAFHGVARTIASSTPRTASGAAATRAERAVLPATGS